MSEPCRLDAVLVMRGIVGGRDKAKSLIEQGHVQVNGKTVTKASMRVDETDTVVCDVREQFVGRGGEKLLKVLQDTSLCADGCCCVDVGASTGGFTDCLLQHGAFKVYAVDVGHDQLALSLREDDRVVCLEGVDIRRRDIVCEYISDGEADIVTIDVSFISLTQIWQAVTPLLKESGVAVCLIKPQFEAGRAALSKRGVVKSPKDHVRVLQTVLGFWQEQGFTCSYLSWSPIKGGEGNIEYIAVVSRQPSNMPMAAQDVVAAAWQALS